MVGFRSAIVLSVIKADREANKPAGRNSMVCRACMNRKIALRART